jgi:hypothetical protein
MGRHTETDDRVEYGGRADQGNVGTAHDTDIDRIKGDHGQNRGKQVQDLELGIQNRRHCAGDKTAGQQANRSDR